jgi:hypothetical protein
VCEPPTLTRRISWRCHSLLSGRTAGRAAARPFPLLPRLGILGGSVQHAGGPSDACARELLLLVSNVRAPFRGRPGPDGQPAGVEGRRHQWHLVGVRARLAAHRLSHRGRGAGRCPAPGACPARGRAAPDRGVGAGSDAGDVRAWSQWAWCWCPYQPTAGTGPASVAVERRRLHFRLNPVHPLTGAGWLHRQHFRVPAVDPLIPVGPKLARERLKRPDNLGLWQTALMLFPPAIAAPLLCDGISALRCLLLVCIRRGRR